MTEQNPLFPDSDIEANVNRDYQCFVFGKLVTNTPPRIVISFILTVIILISSFTFMFLKENSTSVFAPIVSAIVAFWLPSPVQTQQSRTEALQLAYQRGGNFAARRVPLQ
jgi:hypothetical protein